MLDNTIFYLSAAASIIAALATAFIAIVAKKASALQSESFRLGLEREYAERQISDLHQRLQDTEQRFHEMNRLIIESGSVISRNKNEEEGEVKTTGSKFLKALGLDIRKIEIENRRVFYLTPYSEIYNDELKAVRAACHRKNLILRRGDEQFVQGSLLRHILTEIAKSNLVIANITGRNPNVFYELGIAQMMDKRVLMIANYKDKLAFDVSHQQIIIYRNPVDLVESLSVALDNAYIDYK